MTLSDGTEAALDPGRCAEVERSIGIAKGAGPARTEGWFFELGTRMGGSPEDAFTERLHDFSYSDSGDGLTTLNASVLAGFSLHRNFGVFARYTGLERREFERSFTGEWDDADLFSWRSHALGLGARARLPLAHEWVAFYAQVNGGVALTRSRWSALDPDGVRVDASERDWGPWVEGALGFQGHILKNFGLFVEGGWGYSNALENLLGERHNGSAGFVNTGLRLRTMGVK